MIPSWVHAGVWLLVMLTAGVAFLATLLIWRNGYVRGWRGACRGSGGVWVIIAKVYTTASGSQRKE